MDYLSKRLDSVSASWPACFGAVAVTTMLRKDADKLTLGQELFLTTPNFGPPEGLPRKVDA